MFFNCILDVHLLQLIWSWMFICSNHLLKCLFFLYWKLHLHPVNWAYFCESLPRFSVLLLWSMFVSSLPHYIDYCRYKEVLELDCFLPTIFFQSCLRYSSSFAFPLINIIYIYKNLKGILIDIILKLFCLGRINIFTMLNISVHEHSIFLLLFRLPLGSFINIV